MKLCPSSSLKKDKRRETLPPILDLMVPTKCTGNVPAVILTWCCGRKGTIPDISFLAWVTLSANRLYGCLPPYSNWKSILKLVRWYAIIPNVNTLKLVVQMIFICSAHLGRRYCGSSSVQERTLLFIRMFIKGV